MTFDQAIQKMIDRAGDDYHAWLSHGDRDDATIDRDVDNFREGFEVKHGRSYAKIIATNYGQRSVWGFVQLKDSGKFKQGDILKAAGWNAPAKNKARGNIFEEYQVKWTGPLYL